jgi:hypothetical protein
MKYLLVVGFSCEVYRREPRARLFFNEQLVDEFYIPHQDDKKNLIHPIHNLKHRLEPCTDKIEIEHLQNSLPLLRFYELDVNDKLQQVLIRIDVDNDDSNYNNGFITKSTQLQFKVLSLLPADRKIYEWFALKSQTQRLTDRYAWHRKNLYNVFFSLVNNSTWIGKNRQKFTNIAPSPNGIYNGIYTIGGSGSLHCELIKKYGILLGRFQCAKHTYIYMVKNTLHTIIYDKYEKYANQRNTD